MAERLLLLPGWSYSSAALQPLATALRELSSGALQVELAELPVLTEAEHWLDALEAQLPRDTWLGGWSLGGMLAAQLAARRGVACRGLICIASNLCFQQRSGWPDAMPVETLAAFRQGLAADTAVTLQRFDLLASQGDSAQRALRRQLQGMRTEADEGVLAAGLECLAQLDGRAALATWQGPHLHLFAEQDVLVPVAAAQATRRHLPQAHIEVIEQVSHAAPFSHARQVAGSMLAFIQESAR
ncbi:alpha/beta fold hydrolase [Pseudomonas sp. B392_1p]|uniref:alpha/beta fold hydrolase n=1 Tax=Pseudomonas sp. B392_1p TaxID=3457507 RepID=UPI003FD359D0